MRLPTGVLLALVGALQVSATNFWIIEALIEEGCISTGEPCGTVNDLALISQDGTNPGCVQFDSARAVGGYPPPSFFSGPACGINLNFYQQGDGSYQYFQDNGSGSPLGSCTRNDGPTFTCADVDFLGLTTVNGRYTCNNFDNSKNGINPCVP